MDEPEEFAVIFTYNEEMHSFTIWKVSSESLEKYKATGTLPTEDEEDHLSFSLTNSGAIAQIAFAPAHFLRFIMQDVPHEDWKRVDKAVLAEGLRSSREALMEFAMAQVPDSAPEFPPMAEGETFGKPIGAVWHKKKADE